MIFYQPAFLLGLLAIPILAGLYLLAQRRRRNYTLRFTNLALLKTAVGNRPGYRRHVPPALLLIGGAALLTGLAAPVLNLEVARNDASVMLLVDVSGSMQATDVQPTRLDAARSAARSLVDSLPGNDRVGLISFNGAARLDVPLTRSRSEVRNALDALQADGATAIGSAISLAVQQLAPRPAASAARTAASGVRRAPAMIVLLTDGVSNTGMDPLTAAAQAKAAGIRVQTVGIGQKSTAVRVHGQEVGGVDELALQAVAESTGGSYYYAEAASQLKQIYTSLGSQFGWQFQRVDLAVPLSLTGLLALLAAATASLVWFRVLP